jgi:hypothetical protein
MTPALLVAIVLATAPHAAEHTHGSPPAPVATPLPSGKAREAGIGGPEMMESTTVESSFAVQCAQAARGIVMLDRAALARCTGQAPVEAPKKEEPAATPHHQH